MLLNPLFFAWFNSVLIIRAYKLVNGKSAAKEEGRGTSSPNHPPQIEIKNCKHDDTKHIPDLPFSRNQQLKSSDD